MPHKPKGSIIAAIDIGSSKIAALIGHVIDNEGRVEVIGVGHHASKGTKNGGITDMAVVEDVIRQSVGAAENMAAREMDGYPLRDVVVNVPPVYARTDHVKIDIDMMGHEVTKKDIQRAIHKGQKKQKRDEWDIIHSIPISYSLDGHNNIEKPVGMQAQGMEIDLNIVSAEDTALNNIHKCISRAHLDIDGYCLGVYAAGLSCLSEEELELGATIIDIGGGVTSFAFFAQGTMLHAGSIPLGGDHVTNDIVLGVNTTRHDAERLKILYGSALATSSDEAEMLDIPQLNDNGDMVTHHVPRSMLISIIQPRLEEILEMIRDKMEACGFKHVAGHRVILTGGSSQIPGLRDLVQMVLGSPARLGKPLHIKGLPEAASGPSFAVATGLLHYICERSNEKPYEIAASAQNVSAWQKFRGWLKDNW